MIKTPLCEMLGIEHPIIQGGMGVRVSRSGLAAAVANEGCVGVIAGVGLGKFENRPGSESTTVRLTPLMQIEPLSTIRLENSSGKEKWYIQEPSSARTASTVSAPPSIPSTS